MKMKHILLTLVLALSSAAYSKTVETTSSSSGSTSAVSYADTTDGLKKLIEDTLAATKDGTKDRVDALVKSLVLPNHEAWFKKIFGEEKGARLAADYGSKLSRLQPDVTELFAKMISEGKTEVRIRRFTTSGDREATGLQNQVLAAMTNPVPLYSVRMVRPGEELGMHLWSFVHADGSFRLAGKMEAIK